LARCYIAAQIEETVWEVIASACKRVISVFWGDILERRIDVGWGQAVKLALRVNKSSRKGVVVFKG
jgi:hypothetical protein